MATLSQGTSITFTGFSGSPTRITINKQDNTTTQERQRVSTAHLGSDINLEEPYVEVWQPSTSVSSGSTVDVEYLGTGTVSAGTSGTLTVSGAISYSGTATCISSSVTAAVGDVVRGSASFRI